MTDICLSFENLVPEDLGSRSFAALGAELSARQWRGKSGAPSGGIIRFEFDDPSKVGDLVLLNCANGGMVWVFDDHGQIIETVDLPLTPENTKTTVTFGIRKVARMDVRIAGKGSVSELSFLSPKALKPGKRMRISYRDLPAPQTDEAEAEMPHTVGARYKAPDLAGRPPVMSRPRVALNLVYDADKVKQNPGLDDLPLRQPAQSNSKVPCFTPGTQIATPQGLRSVEELQVGDKVLTRDNGVQKLCWTGRREISQAQLLESKHLRPVLIRKGALGKGLPDRDMAVSPNHKMLLQNERMALYFKENEAFVCARHLVNCVQGVSWMETAGVSYSHIMFEKHEVINANGAWTESFRPSTRALEAVGDVQRTEIFELFPELLGSEGRDAFSSARPNLQEFEAKLLFS